jgi:hypothetical protein
VRLNLRQIQDLYERFLTAESIAESIQSICCSESTKVAKEIMKKNHFDVLGLTDDAGRVTGYIDIHCPDDGICKKYCMVFGIEDLVSLQAPLKDCISLMRDTQRLFVLGSKGVEGIITLADLHKQPVRMLLFSQISLLEMSMVDLVKERYPNDKWQENLAEGRVNKARALYDERIRSNQDVSLVECLQFSDKCDILLKDDIWKEWRFESKSKGKECFKNLRELRDNLAHSQSKIWSDISKIISLLEKTENILEININILSQILDGISQSEQN